MAEEEEFTISWFCRSCWRRGEFICGHDDDPVIQAMGEHRRDVNFDRNANRVPAGMLQAGPQPMRFRSLDCRGDLRVSAPRRRKRFDKSSGTVLDFDSGKKS